MNPEPKETARMGFGYGDPIVLEGAIELVSGAGMVCHNDKGEVMLHIHVALSDVTGAGYGGHLIPGNEVLLTTDVVLGVVEGVEMLRLYDEQTDLVQFDPQQR